MGCPDDDEVAVLTVTGPIPSEELGLLMQLTELYAPYESITRGRQLTGSIPTQLGMLTKLRVLDLGHSTALTGSIPSELGLLKQLTILALSDNALSGTIPTQLQMLSRLRSLDLNRNTLTGSIPTHLGMPTQLTARVVSS